MSYRYISVFSLSWRTRGLVMVSNDRSLNIFVRGSWSTAMRFGLPMTNILHLWSPNTAANASPSIGAYRLSLSLVNLEPANTSFQCPSPNPGRCCGWHLQCFWARVNPMPVLDQSVARQVGWLVSKDFTPSCTSLTISSLKAAKISSKVESQ